MGGGIFGFMSWLEVMRDGWWIILFDSGEQPTDLLMSQKHGFQAPSKGSFFRW